MYLEKGTKYIGRCDICFKEATMFVILEVDREPYEFDRCCMCKDCVTQAYELIKQDENNLQISPN